MDRLEDYTQQSLSVALFLCLVLVLLSLMSLNVRAVLRFVEGLEDVVSVHDEGGAGTEQGKIDTAISSFATSDASE